MADVSSITTLVEKLHPLIQIHTSSSPVPPPWQLPSADLPPSSSAVPPTFDLQMLKRTVARIDAVLKDAEEREIGEESVRRWLKDLKGVAYEADDLLDEYDYECLRVRADAEVQIAATASAHVPRSWMGQEVCDEMISSPLNASFLINRIQKIVGKLEVIRKLRDDLHLREGDGPRRSSEITVTRSPPSSHLMDVPNPRGRRDDLAKVVGMLLSDECLKSDLFMIAIFGIAGVGKTTLAQLVYNDLEVRSLFQLQGWVSVSDDFEVVALSRKIFQAFTQTEQKLEELSAIQEMLIEKIRGRRFLLILDDIWNERSDLWNRLLLPLKHGKPGSAVIITTRNQSVATIMAPAHHHHHHHHLQCLSQEDCWEVLKQSAFYGKDVPESSDYPDLIDIGMQIARMCKGLPLAAVSMGCLLSRDYDAESWRDVLESKLWDVDDKIIPALMVSYVHLPGHLKRCFLYASLFPKGSVFNKDEVVRLWMAQGFLPQSGRIELESVGNRYFDELLNRSFFQKNPGDPSLFMMHDLMHDLAQYISRGEHVVMEIGSSSPVQEARHLSLDGADSIPCCYPFCLAPDLRTVLVLQQPYHQFLRDPMFFTGRVPLIIEMMLIKLKFLRVLNLRGVGLRWLPEAVGNLKHLRYLNLQNNEIEILPDSIGKLYHLQTLITGGSTSIRKLERLPTGITGLANLRCLEVGSDSTRMPRGICKLTSLRSLDVFNVGEGSEDCAQVEELKALIHLRGRLTINNILSVVDTEKAREAGLGSKAKVSDLTLNGYCGKWGTLYSPEHLSLDRHREVMESLRPHVGLKHLRILKYCGVTFPGWLGDPCFSRLATVEISYCTRSIALPSLGHLPSLRCLKVRCLCAVKVVGSEFLARAAVGFPALEELLFEGMLSWTAWQGVRRGDFPRLRRLELKYCPRQTLVAPLYHRTALEELVLHGCEKLTSIELWSPASSSSLPPSPSSTRPCPPLKKMEILMCPQVRFTQEDKEQLLLPLTLQDLFIHSDCRLLVEWCQTEAGIRSLSGIPGAKLWKDEDGRPFVSTHDERELYEEYSCHFRPHNAASSCKGNP